LQARWQVLSASDVCTAAVWTLPGLATRDLSFAISLARGVAHIAGVGTRPDECRMLEVARRPRERGYARVPPLLGGIDTSVDARCALAGFS
jgi:hypothetical protein